ncbi:ABC-type multidrug transport system fused ATPase/permease subunit [Isoptericola sp. CG 20/1183]|uniref:ABC-type multidrug transport system fused ATPase/permease subunit n=1 Tax=Isoptericola halotolerans TaxID=300560 RepID=A0ABX5EE10_9MICO|nr:MULTISPECIES: ABC transporter ATP-binding protein [Isoptericola]PRZ06938.1 ABC-type multidrug transport system fused ATPase/permease subunit [Isoptericola halotolerans]PRZ07390.1 ABC-type multidrug transport system fused ATPase/permease subunit [Isoptericola sp. CG 20/1183]
MIDATTSAPPIPDVPVPADDPSRRLDWRRLRSPVSTAAVVALTLGAVGTAVGTVVAGELAASPGTTGVVLLALCLVGGALLDAAGQVAWAGVVDRAEGRLRGDLLSAALHQPIEVLGEQAVGEVLDRVDDDTHAVGALARRQLWSMGRTVVGVVPIWVVAGVTWWPAFFLFPVLGVGTWWTVRSLLGEIARRKVVEERAWTDDAAVLEEGVAARDDLRTAGGQAFALRRLAEMSAVVHGALLNVVRVETRMMARVGVLLHALLAGVVVSGVALAVAGDMSVERLVTLFLVTSLFVGQIDRLAQHLPDLQEGLGAVVRIRQLLDTEPEPVGGLPLPERPLEIEVRDLDFAYTEGTFALRGVSLSVPAGQTVAFVGRTGSGKTTLASLLSRAVEPPRGAVLLGGVDVRDADLQQLRAGIGVVTQRTEIVAGTLAENIALFADLPRRDVEEAVVELGLTEWVAGLSDGLDTLLGPGGTSLSAGEEQLVAFARLLVRDVRVVVLDEATARMDPHTEARVVAAADRLLTGRTGVVVAHRLGTVERADRVVVLDHGRVVQQGPRAELAGQEGAFRDLLLASRTGGDDVLDGPAPRAAHDVDDGDTTAARPGGIGARRRTGEPPVLDEPGHGPSLTRSVLHALVTKPRWGAGGAVLFLLASLFAAQGALAGFLWGRSVESLAEGGEPWLLTGLLAVMLIVAPLCLALAVRLYPSWWIELLLRVRVAVLEGQTRQRRLRRTPPGEVVARALDADRFVLYVDRWVDLLNGFVVVLVTWLVSGEALAGVVLLAVMGVTAVSALAGRPIAGRTATRSAEARAGFGRALVSALDAARTVKLAARTPDVHRHLRQVDAGRVGAAIREHRVQAVLDGIPTVMVQAGVVAAWALLLAGTWDLATTLLVTAAVGGFAYFGVVAGAVITEAPGTRSWLRATSSFAAGADLTRLPAGVDLTAGTAPAPARVPTGTAVGADRFERLALRGLEAVHDDGTIGVTGVELEVRRGELVLLLGQVGSGKSSLLSALAGLMAHRGTIAWNGTAVTDPEVFLRPGRVAHVAQVPRVLSGTFTENVRLDHDRQVAGPLEAARIGADVADAGGPDALVGHRGVRLSGGQVQRLALARALATDAEVLLADDVSSALDAATEIELWVSLRERGTTVIGSTSKRAALARADRVVVLTEGRVAAVGPWRELAARWSHLAG